MATLCNPKLLQCGCFNCSRATRYIEWLDSLKQLVQLSPLLLVSCLSPDEVTTSHKIQSKIQTQVKEKIYIVLDFWKCTFKLHNLFESWYGLIRMLNYVEQQPSWGSRGICKHFDTQIS